MFSIPFTDLEWTPMSRTSRASSLAFVVQHVAITSRGPRKLSTAIRARRLGCLSGLLALVP